MSLTPASAIRPRAVHWLWDGRIALGTLSLLAGREGLGKSTVAYWIAARITRGELPGRYAGQPRGVLIAATEDSWEHTIVPRLMAAGADLDRVYRIEVVTSEDTHAELSLPKDLADVEDAARETAAALLLLDPLMSRIDAGLDTHRDGEVRRALEPTVTLADRTGMAVLGLIHHNKSGSTDPLHLVMGSKAFTAVARSVHTVVPDADDDTGARRLFGTPKNNLGRTDLPSLAFTIATHLIETDAFDDPIVTGCVEWGGEVEVTIEESMRRAADSIEDRGTVADAAAWLEDYLIAHGGQVASKDAKDAGRRAGHSERAIVRASKRLRLTIGASGFPRTTTWELAVTPASHANSSGETT